MPGRSRRSQPLSGGCVSSDGPGAAWKFAGPVALRSVKDGGQGTHITGKGAGGSGVHSGPLRSFPVDHRLVKILSQPLSQSPVWSRRLGHAVLPSSAIPSGGQGAQRRGQARPPQTCPVALPLLSPRLSQESQSRGPAGALTRESARSLLCTEVWGAGASDSRSVRALRLHRIKNKLRRVDSRLGTSEWPHFLFPRFE